MSIRDIHKNKLLISTVILLFAIASLALVPTKTCAKAGDLVLASSTAGGAAGALSSYKPSISPDGRYVAFFSSSNNFPSWNGQWQVYRKDISTGAIVLASSTAGGAAGASYSSDPSISSDGRYVAFYSLSNNFPGSNGQTQVYRKDISTGAIVLASSTALGTAGASRSSDPSISPDGSYVVFESNSNNFPGQNGQDQVYRKDISTGAIDLVSSTAGGTAGASYSHFPSLSSDGRYVAFQSASNNFPGQNGQDQVYRKQLESLVPIITGIDPASKTAGDSAFDLTVNGTNFEDVSKVRWNGADRTTTYVSDTELSAAIPAADIETAGTASVTVFNPTPGGGESNAQTFTVTSAPVTATPTWYLAEGSTAWGFSQYISIINPNTEAVTARITYMTTTGPTSPPDIVLPASSQTTINPRDTLGDQDFSTKVECLEGETIAVDRTMTWTGEGAASEEAHNSVGVPSPEKVWYLPEGSSAWGFECWLLIQNPNDSEATCYVTYMIEWEGPKTFTKTVPASSRKTFNMADDIGSNDASIKVEADLPVIPERAMYRNNRREGHDSIGTTAPAEDYYLAEGTTAWGFTTYVLVQNPQSTPTDVTITYMTPQGPNTQPAFQMPANSRKTIRVNDSLPSTDLSTQVHGSQPVIAERAMYWDKGTGEACHDSIGMDSPHTTFYLPDGESSEGRETWTLVQNPNSSSVAIEVSYLTPSGAGNVVFADNIPANSRKTYNMADSGLSGRASVMVRALDSGKKIMCERAMYWNSRGAGTDTIGGYSE